jgi:hypothetical protein
VLRVLETFDRLDKGEYGRVAPTKAPEGTFSGTNVLTYGSRLVGPRAGVRPTNWTLTAGTLAGFGQFTSDSSFDYWAVVGTSVFSMVDGSSTVTTATGSLAGTPTAAVQGASTGTNVHFTSYSDKTYYTDGSTVTAIVGSPGGKCMVKFGEFLLVANTGSGTRNRIRYSNPADFATWPAGSNFDVGNDGAITGLYVVRNQLWIVKDTGEWWTYTGVPGENDSLRLVYTGCNYPPDFRAGAVVGFTVTYVGVDDDFPTYYNGSTVEAIGELTLNDSLYGAPSNPLDPPVSVTSLSREGDAVIMAGSSVSESRRRCLVQKDSVWTRHLVRASWAVQRVGANGEVIVSDGGSASGAPRFWYWRATEPDDPPTDANELTDDGNAFDTELVFPERILSGTKQVRVTQLVVDLRRYNPDGLPARLTAEVAALNPWEGSGPIVSQPVTHVFPDDQVTDADPVRVRLHFGSTGWGAGFRVTFRDLRGVALEKVLVLGEEQQGMTP